LKNKGHRHKAFIFFGNLEERRGGHEIGCVDQVQEVRWNEKPEAKTKGTNHDP